MNDNIMICVVFTGLFLMGALAGYTIAFVAAGLITYLLGG